jgi:RimJ/RimL family protein N-acetyltransferase
MKSLIFRIGTKRDSLVYRFSSDDALMNVDKHVQWKILERIDLKTFFPDNYLIRRSCIESFKKKHWCVILYDEVNWISYGWVRPPKTKAPPHLPYWVGATDDYWLYTIHTNTKYRKMGYSKFLKKIRINLIHEYEGKQEVNIYADTVVTNIASRRSMLSSGFLPAGILTRYYIKSFKYMNYLLYRNRWGFVWGVWDKNRPHSFLPIH